MSNSVESPGLQADEVVLEARDQAVLADDQRHPLGRAAVERHAVLGAREPDDGVVAFLRRRAPRPAASVAFWSRSSSMTVVDLGLVDGLDLGREVEVLVVAELDLRADLDGRLEDERLALARPATTSTSAFVSGTMSCSTIASR